MISPAEHVDCISCDEDSPNDVCGSSETPCGHHCNHSWSHDVCCWCEEEMHEIQGR